MTRSKQIAKINLIRSERKNNIFLTYPFPKSQQDILIKIFFFEDETRDEKEFRARKHEYYPW